MKKIDDMYGNMAVRTVLKNCLNDNRLDKFIIFHGRPGTGKSALSEIIASMLVNDETVLEKLDQGRSTDNVSKINMTRFTKEKDTENILKEVFLLKNDGIKVYILEEFQAVPQKEQVKFLEEFRKQDDETYVFICSSEVWKINKALRDRASSFELKNLGKVDARSFALLFLDGADHSFVDELVRMSDYNPRKIMKNATLVRNGKITDLSIMAEVLGGVQIDEVIGFLNAMSMDMSDFVDYVDRIEDPRLLTQTLKRQSVEILKTVYGKSKLDNLVKRELVSALEKLVKTESDLLDLLDQIEKLDESIVDLIRMNRKSNKVALVYPKYEPAKEFTELNEQELINKTANFIKKGE